MSKHYFRENDDELCYTRASIIEQMKNEGITELSVVEAKRETAMGYFYCQEYNEVGEVGESCGKQCDGYKPRNGKSGRCVYSGNCYSPSEKKRTFKVKKMTLNEAIEVLQELKHCGFGVISNKDKEAIITILKHYEEAKEEQK